MTYITQTNTYNNLIYLTQVLTNEISNSANTTWVQTGLSITPPVAGTYICLYSASMFCEGGGNVIAEIDIQKNGVTINGSVRQTRQATVMLLGIIGGNNIDAGANSCVIEATVDGTQAITVRFRRNGAGSTISLRNRSLTLIKVG